MSNLNVDQKTVRVLFTEKKASFLIPDYQRPYAWDIEQCQTLWDDIFNFSFPDNNTELFNENEEYFLGSVVVFKNENNQFEVIDGQQRLTTLLLLLRAFYDKFTNMKDKNSISTREMIEKCIWQTDTFNNIDKDKLKIDSEVATDNDKEEFLEILRNGKVESGGKSLYAKNYKFFTEQIENFIDNYSSYFPYLPARILNNCILLPVEAESQDTALRIFSTLNDRGLPLSDADIFKAQLYKFYKSKGKKGIFIDRWKELEERVDGVMSSPINTPMDELFTRYMYYLRAKEGNKSTTTEALRKFFERGKYKYLKNEEVMFDLESLALFWSKIKGQDKEFSDSVLRKLFVLNFAPNSMWEYVTSVYFLQNKNSENGLGDERFGRFLDKITAFIYAYSISAPGVNSLRTSVYDAMVRIVNNEEVTFFKDRFAKNFLRSRFESYVFSNKRLITRSMVFWYAFTFENQKLLDVDDRFQIEHIFARKRQMMERTLSDENSLESLGNKIILENYINIKASDYRFEDKKKIYTGEMYRGKNKEPSKIAEIAEISKLEKWTEEDIKDREKKILDSFFEFLQKEDLLKD